MAPDRIVGLIAVLVGVFFIFQSLRLPTLESGRPGSGFFPLLAAVLMASAGLWLVAAIGRAGSVSTDVAPIPVRAVFTLILAFACYIALIQIIGYALSTFGFAVAVLRSFGTYTWRRIVVAAALLTVAHVLVFEFLLGMPLPRNPLELP